MTKDVQDLFPLLNGKNVFVFGSDPSIENMLLLSYFDTGGYRLCSIVHNKTKIEKDDTGKIINLKVKLSSTDLRNLRGIFLDNINMRNKITIGINMFSVYFSPTIAMWADDVSWIKEAIYNNCVSPYKLSRNNNLFNEIECTHVFNKCADKGRFDRTGKNDLDAHILNVALGNEPIDMEYKGYLYAGKTTVLGAIHLCALAGAKSCVVSGVGLDPFITRHFYEPAKSSVQKRRGYGGNATQDRLCYIRDNCNTKFYKTNPNSLLPFEYKDLKEFYD